MLFEEKTKCQSNQEEGCYFDYLTCFLCLKMIVNGTKILIRWLFRLLVNVIPTHP